MKNNVKEILLYAVLALAALILISFLAGFFAWIWSKLVLGFATACILWIVQKLRGKQTGNLYIVWWGIAISALLVGLDLLTIVIARYAWLVFVALIIGIIVWAIAPKKK